jgi:hypothetical protein
MDAKRPVPRWQLLLATTAVAGFFALAGCTLDKQSSQPGGVFERIGGHNGQVVEPKRCMLKVAIISRPFGDPVINEVVWRVADEQSLPPEERRGWESNGLRAGLVTGEFPLELEAILKDTSPGKVINPIAFFPEPGDQQLIRIADSVAEASLLLNRDHRAFGKDFKDASGYFRVTLGHHGAQGVSLRLVPEIHHGPVQRNFQAITNPSPIAAQELRIADTQHEETLGDLPINLVVEPGQAVVIGCYPEHKRVLGHFFFTQGVAHSDQREQKIIVIWASRNLEGVVAEHAGAANDRPKRFKRQNRAATKSAIPTSSPDPSDNPEIPNLPRIIQPMPVPTTTPTPTATPTGSSSNISSPPSQPAAPSQAESAATAPKSQQQPDN